MYFMLVAFISACRPRCMPYPEARVCLLTHILAYRISNEPLTNWKKLATRLSSKYLWMSLWRAALKTLKWNRKYPFHGWLIYWLIIWAIERRRIGCLGRLYIAMPGGEFLGIFLRVERVLLRAGQHRMHNIGLGLCFPSEERLIWRFPPTLKKPRTSGRCEFVTTCTLISTPQRQWVCLIPNFQKPRKTKQTQKQLDAYDSPILPNRSGELWHEPEMSLRECNLISSDSCFPWTLCKWMKTLLLFNNLTVLIYKTL